MSSDHLKLYESSGSPNSRRVRIFLAEKGISVSRIPVDLGAKEQFSEAYAKINPRRVVPSLVLEDGTVIAEVPAILRYLEEAYPNAPLLGTSATDKALVTMWERRMELEGFAAVMETVRNKVPGLKGRAIAGPHDSPRPFLPLALSCARTPRWSSAPRPTVYRSSFARSPRQTTTPGRFRSGLMRRSRPASGSARTICIRALTMRRHCGGFGYSIGRLDRSDRHHQGCGRRQPWLCQVAGSAC